MGLSGGAERQGRTHPSLFRAGSNQPQWVKTSGPDDQVGVLVGGLAIIICVSIYLRLEHGNLTSTPLSLSARLAG